MENVGGFSLTVWQDVGPSPGGRNLLDNESHYFKRAWQEHVRVTVLKTHQGCCGLCDLITMHFTTDVGERQWVLAEI